MRRWLILLLLGVAGLMLLAIGAAVLLQPHAFFAANGVALGSEPSLLSEIRAPGGLLVGCAIVMLLGVFRQAATRSALILAAMVYGLFGLSRLVSIVSDGLPSTSLIGATVTELIVGALCVIALTHLKPAQIE